VKTISLSIFENKNLASLPSCVEGGALPALVSGLGPIHRANLAAALRQKTDRPLFVVAPDDSSADIFAADLKSFLQEDVAVIYGREYTFYGSERVSRQGEQKRLAVLDAMAQGRAEIVVCTAAALSQRTLPPSVLDRVCFTLRPGQTLAPEDVADALLRAGYRGADQVEGPGQFAHRGGILDIWSTAEENPARLDFFGDEIDTIHSFDPSSQRRTQAVKSLRILPGAETLPSLAEGGKAALAAQIKALSARLNMNASKFDVKKLRQTMEKDIEALEQDTDFTAADRYMCLVYPQKATVLDYVPMNALVFMDQPGKCAERAKSHLKQAGEDLRLLIEGGTLLGRIAEFYRSWEETVEKMADFPVVMADAFTMGQYPLSPRSVMSLTAKQLPSYAGSAQAAADDVRHWLGEGYRCVVLAGDKRRAEALKDVLYEKDIKNVYIDSRLNALPEPGRCVISLGSLPPVWNIPRRSWQFWRTHRSRNPACAPPAGSGRSLQAPGLGPMRTFPWGIWWSTRPMVLAALPVFSKCRWTARKRTM